jgi:hypothetical protein
MSFLTEAKNGMKLKEHLDTGKFNRVLIPFWHGVGDVVMVLPIIVKLRELYPQIEFKLGLCKGLDQETFVPDAVLLEGDWREKALTLGFDLVFPVNFPLERPEDLTKTKAEICCEEEIGIPPVCGHLPLKAKKLVGVCFQCTSVPWVANAEPEIAEKIWNDIKEAGYVPIETQFIHVFANPDNKLFPCVDAHFRGCPAKIQTLMSVLGSCVAFVGTVGGNFHLALSVLGPGRVMLLEKDLKKEHFTKEKIATANLKDYQGEVKKWLEGLNA